MFVVVAGISCDQVALSPEGTPDDGEPKPGIVDIADQQLRHPKVIA